MCAVCQILRGMPLEPPAGKESSMSVTKKQESPLARKAKEQARALVSFTQVLSEGNVPPSDILLLTLEWMKRRKW